MDVMKQDETGRQIVPVLACVLGQLCAKNDEIPLDPKAVTKFHALRAPGIGIKEYLERISKYAACSGECFILALVYIDRIIQTNPTFMVCSLNIHRLLITSIMLAAKFFDDHYFNNAYYAKVGGVPCQEINSLEVEFLFMINFSLYCNFDTYKQYLTELCNHPLHGCKTCKKLTLEIPSYPQIPHSNRKLDKQLETKSNSISPQASDKFTPDNSDYEDATDEKSSVHTDTSQSQMDVDMTSPQVGT